MDVSASEPACGPLKPVLAYVGRCSRFSVNPENKMDRRSNHREHHKDSLDHSVFLSTEPYQLSGTFKLEIDARNKEI